MRKLSAILLCAVLSGCASTFTPQVAETFDPKYCKETFHFVGWTPTSHAGFSRTITCTKTEIPAFVKVEDLPR